jgi:hypothetical protein
LSPDTGFRCCAVPGEKAIGFEDKVSVILIPRTVVGIGIQDQLGIGHILREIKRIHGVDNDVVVATHDERRLRDVRKVRNALSRACRAPVRFLGRACAVRF